MPIEQRRCIWIAGFCLLTVTAAAIVMILYHTFLRFEPKDLIEPKDPKDHQKINQNNSEGKTSMNTYTIHCIF